MSARPSEGSGLIWPQAACLSLTELRIVRALLSNPCPSCVQALKVFQALHVYISAQLSSACLSATEPGRALKKLFDAVYVILTHPTFLTS